MQAIIKIAILTLIVLFFSLNLKAQTYSIVYKSNEFCFDFYKECSNGNSENIFVSPFSISCAIAMIYPGAVGKTQEEMKQAMGFLNNLKKQNDEYAFLLRDLTGSGSPLMVTNTLWTDIGMNYKKEFMDINAAYFGSNFKQVAFANADDTRNEINAAIEKQTHNKIKNVMPQGSIDSDTRLVITNAVYFKESWAIPFQKDKSSQGKFHIAPKETVNTTFMQQTGSFKAFENDVVSILELPYKNGSFSMIILLPKIGMEEFENDFLNSENYSSWTLFPIPFNKILIPRFTMEQATEPVPILRRFGMTTAFDESKADFSGITTDRPLVITGIYHKAFVDVNEEGTEASAATAMSAGIRSMQREQQPRDFIADHPFIFLIQDIKSQSILFMGKFANP